MENFNPEYQYQVAVFTITALSNLHVGSGSENYGIIDNLVQRDPLTGFPCIYSSSLKGALREYFRYYLNLPDKSAFLSDVFGTDKKDLDENGKDGKKENKEKGKEEFKAGKYRFLQADLLSFPVRSDKRLYYRSTCPFLIDNLVSYLCKLDKKVNLDNLKNALGNEDAIQFSDEGEAILEELDLKAKYVLKDISTYNDFIDNCEKFAIVKDEKFAELVSDFHLPVIARNNLNNGQSTNLWYEQVLPRKTKFIFAVLYPKGDKYFTDFKCLIEKDETPVQIGANASIGYGFCSIKEVNITKDESK